MRARRFVGRLWGDREGAAALELALVLPTFAMLVVGVINAAQLAHAVSSMNFAVEEAARCSAVNAVTCGSATATEAYAASKYLGPSISPVFDSTTAGCGHTVTATATFELNVAIGVYEVPLNAAACYPGVNP
jgi:Flp pilus assembly protein TadG